ncbi:MAG: HAD family hydrolase [Rothia sp. (in: high G+C Gram-positive bacteria)]|uniref:HAD-IIB family hydrolase n=1 Tax=Rothia sp. (in: high G+C Gram-positive bacteria) TaxID=1885016 RepID=UPI0026DEADF0|nr:HAD family hydrolase [Rothia sp. (in: high G+C Gram-positive bacteria)]MDO5749659.1 HAD family hydrolase [Rothia sp. (in: high G+C Gram-positive bacteria)]
MTIKLIATDLDGTVIGRDFKFRPRTLAALQAAEHAGMTVLFVTGRPARWLDPLREQTTFDSYAICSNGAVLYHLGTDEVEEVNGTSAAVIERVNTILQAAYPQATYTLETLDTVYIQGSYEGGEVLEGARVVESTIERALAEIGDAPIIKFLIRVEGAEPTQLQSEIERLVGEYVFVTRGVVGEPLVEMGDPQVNKGVVLARFAARHGIDSSQVMAFGDMPNDTQMLHWAGTGFAMASGNPELIRSVGRTCPAFEQDGVAQTIEALLDGTLKL